MSRDTLAKDLYNILNSNRTQIDENYCNECLDDTDIDGVVCGCTKLCFTDVLDEEVIKVSAAEFLKNTDDGCDTLCKEEVKIYNLACQVGVEMAFAATYKFGTYNDVNFYAQEKIDQVGANRGGSHRENSVNKSKQRLKNMDMNMPEDFLATLYDSYDDVMVEKILKFCEEQEINDLHCGNIGVREDGTAVIFDYSGVPWKSDEYDYLYTNEVDF